MGIKRVVAAVLVAAMVSAGVSARRKVRAAEAEAALWAEATDPVDRNNDAPR